MKTKKSLLGICAICGEERKLTYEHHPPRSAFNDRPVFSQDFRHLTPLGGVLHGKKSLKRQGFGGYTLCRECNNHTGSNYGSEYALFAEQGLLTLYGQQKSTKMVDFVFKVRPLRVLKQIMSLLLSADHQLGQIRSIGGMKEFMLEKHLKSFPSSLNLFMYCTLASTHRFMGLSSIMDFSIETVVHYAEVSFHPFGFVLTYDSPSPDKLMSSIRFFEDYEYEEIDEIKLTLPYYNIIPDMSTMIGRHIHCDIPLMYY